MKKKRPFDVRYLPFLKTTSKSQWLKLGIDRRAGVATPLFSLHSKKSIGVGDASDLKKLIDWCDQIGLSVIQLLPLNDVGFNFWPYDAQSIFALEPMHLDLADLQNVPEGLYAQDLEDLRKKFPCTGLAYDPSVKKAKLEFLNKVFLTAQNQSCTAFEKYQHEQKNWLEDYVLFKVIQELMGGAPWETWPDAYKFRDSRALGQIRNEHAREMLFQSWIQWQLFEQFRNVKIYAQSKGVYLMGDMPYLCSRNSDYVWSHQDHFKLQLSSGAPPDLDFAKGQRWGMPPYNWDAIARTGYESLIQKLRYAENFYHLYRIDHVVGIFRVWTIENHHPIEEHGVPGIFDPSEEWRWEDHGRNLLNVMLSNTGMLACAEDLGTVPDCALKVMGELGIPGLDIQRWTKDWSKGCEFKKNEAYRLAAISAISTHDTSSLRAWWKFEAGTVNGPVFERWCGMYGIDFHAVKEKLFDFSHSHYGRLLWRPEMRDAGAFYHVLGRRSEDVPALRMFYEGSIREKEQFERFLLEGSPSLISKESPIEARILMKGLQASSIFSIQLLQDWLSLDSDFSEASSYEYRINFPSTLNDQNWRLRVPYSMEDLANFKWNGMIQQMLETSGRA